MHGSTRNAAGPPPPHPGGFTLLEAVLVLMITALMASVVAPAVSGTQRTISVDNARTAAVLLGARARAQAANRGAVAYLEFDSENDRAWIRVEEDTLTDSDVDFEAVYGADLQADQSMVTICYSPKGYALFSCSNGLPATLTFEVGSRGGSVTVRALGQIEKDS